MKYLTGINNTMPTNKKTYLVLGANGFIGSYLVERFSQSHSIQVRAFDRYSKKPQFAVTDNVEIFKGNISLDRDIRHALKGVDYVMHCFSATTPFISDQNPYIDITENLIRSVKIFELCAAAGVEKIGFISSGGAVYGTLAEKKVAHETDSPLPISPYGINKLCIEHYLEYFRRKYGIPYSIYRLTNPYGPRQVTKKKQGVIPTFIHQISNDEEITIYGDGKSSRDYIYIEDAALMIADSFERKNKHAIYNIGSGVQTSLNDIIDTLQQVMGKKIRVTYTEAPATFPQKTMVSVERFTQEFDLRSKTSLKKGLRLMIQK
jgi:UDP-glucose 4-epimerase